MNQKRRKEIAKIIKELESIQIRIENLQTEEETAFDNLPTPDKKALPEFANMFLYFINEQIERRFGRDKI